MFRRKHYQSKGRRKESSNELSRVLTYLAYMQKLGYLTEKSFKPNNAINLLTDPQMDDERKSANKIVMAFYNDKVPLTDDSKAGAHFNFYKV